MNVRAWFLIVQLKLARAIVLRKKKKGDLSKRLPGEQGFFLFGRTAAFASRNIFVS
jgi:hypothetical protein